VRLKALTRQICGDERPKQYVPIYGNRTLLRQTWTAWRSGSALPDRGGHAAQPFPFLRRAMGWSGSLRGCSSSPRTVGPPRGSSSRSTGSPARIPTRFVAVFPSDHFVSEPATFMAFVARIAAWVHEHPARLVLLGAHPPAPRSSTAGSSSDDRWPRGWSTDVGGPPVLEKPAAERARLCLEAGCLWNTLVLVGTATMFLRALGRRFQKSASAWPGPCPSVETDAEAWAQAFALIPRADFSRAILESCPPSLAVAAVPRLMLVRPRKPSASARDPRAARSLHAS